MSTCSDLSAAQWVTLATSCLDQAKEAFAHGDTAYAAHWLERAQDDLRVARERIDNG